MKCCISPGFPKIPSKFPPTFMQICMFKVVHRTIHLSKRNDLFCIWKMHFLGFDLRYWTPMNGSYFVHGSILEKCGHFWKNVCFSGRIWPDWGNTTRADMAGLWSIRLMCPSICPNKKDEGRNEGQGFQG